MYPTTIVFSNTLPSTSVQHFFFPTGEIFIIPDNTSTTGLISNDDEFGGEKSEADDR